MTDTTITPSVIISLIIAILFVGTFSSVLIGCVNTQAGAVDSFEKLVANFETIEENNVGVMAYNLPENYLLVSFSGGDDFQGDKSCEDNELIQNPEELCGSASCLCLCSMQYKLDSEEACTEGAVTCKTFEEGTNLRDSTCDSGVYREGPSNGIFTFYIKKTGNNMYFCNSEECFIDTPETSDIALVELE